MTRTQSKGLLIIISILFMPAILYLLLSSGKNHYKQLEIFGPKDVDEKGDTIYHTIPSFSFVNQAGQPVSSQDLNDKIYVANFFFATCPTICPEMNGNLKTVVEKYKDDNRVKFISLTVNPAHDSVEVLAAYAKERDADVSKWMFLTGNKDSIYTLARGGFLVPTGEGQSSGDFIHSENLILVDKQKRIRGIYDGLDEHEVRRLTDEIKVLELEDR